MLTESAASQDQPIRPRLLDRLRDAIRLHYSRWTEEAYSYWTKRFVYFNSKRHPRELVPEHVEAFRYHRVPQRSVVASTRNQII